MVIKDDVLKGPKTGDTTGMSEANTEEPAEENNFEYIHIEKSDDSSSKMQAEDHTKKVEKNEMESKASLKNKTQKAKRNKSEEYWSEYSKRLGNKIYKTAKEEPRHENKWQSQKKYETSAQLRQENTNRMEKSVEKVQNQKPPKLAKPMDIPQHMEDDTMIDYENLISITITNDSAYIGTEVSTTEFVMTNKNTNPSVVQPHDTRVGDRYQVSLPQLKGPVCGKRRNLKTTWRPEIVKESELKVYFDELCKIFNCKEINQDQALRLLKSKKYRKEGVTENIGKNRKYYAKILVAPSADNEVFNVIKP